MRLDFEAMQLDFDSPTQNQSWCSVPRPANRNIVSGKLVFKAKTDANCNVTRFNAPDVARGFCQKPECDFNQTTSPVLSLTTLIGLMAIAAKMDLTVKQMDVHTAFVN